MMTRVYTSACRTISIKDHNALKSICDLDCALYHSGQSPPNYPVPALPMVTEYDTLCWTDLDWFNVCLYNAGHLPVTDDDGRLVKKL